jgi:2-deoxy-D-gluconate 3-dehydrogenase
MPQLPKSKTILSKFDLTGRVAIVTGGPGLLGKQFCRTLAEAGASVVVADINAVGCETVAAALRQDGYQAAAAPTDVTRPDSTQAMVETALSSFGRLDMLVNSAALDPKFDPQALEEMAKRGAISGAFEDYPLDAWKAALDVNLTGMFLCCQAAVRPCLPRTTARSSTSAPPTAWSARTSAFTRNPASRSSTSRSTTRSPRPASSD